MADSVSRNSVDFSQIERVAAGDRALVLEVLALFQGQAPLWAAALEPAADAEAWRNAAHSLKGSALAIGAGALAEACDAAEIAAAVSPQARQPLGERVKSALAATLQETEAYCAGG